MHSIIAKLKSYQFYSAIQNQGGKVYLVGGCVRDHLLKRPNVKDWDMVICHIAIDELINVLKPHGTTNLVGKSFGVIKFHPTENPDIELDIALPRKEQSTGQGHKDFAVNFDKDIPLEQDLLRRDFTINAMAQSLDSDELIDPTDGVKDLESKLIRTVFDQSFVEDPLRLLRAIQFAARLGFSIEEKTFTQLKEHAAKIKTVAPERVATEIKKLFSAEQPSLGFDLMRDTTLLPHLFPDIQQCIGVLQPKKKNEDVYTHVMKVLDASRSAEELFNPGDLDLMFAALFHDTGKPKTHKITDEGKTTFFNHQHISTGIAWRWMKQNKITTIGVNPKHVCHLVKHHMFETKPFDDNDKALRRFVNKVGKDNILDLIDLRLADKKGGRFPKKVYGIIKLRERIIDEINRKTPFSTKDLAIKGQDIMALGYAAGPIIGVIQRFLLEKVLDDPSLNDKDQLSQIIHDHKSEFTQ